MKACEFPLSGFSFSEYPVPTVLEVLDTIEVLEDSEDLKEIYDRAGLRLLQVENREVRD